MSARAITRRARWSRMAPKAPYTANATRPAPQPAIQERPVITPAFLGEPRREADEERERRVEEAGG